ncbi:MAG: tetraacyldisaccharide 4'-kinase [Acidobacteriota bacterium]
MTWRPQRFLAPLSLLYRQATIWRNDLYDRGWLTSSGAGVPVLSVGNLSAGGTGKTPLVALLCTRIEAGGRRPAVVSRGYGGRNARRPGAPALVVSTGAPHTVPVSPAECGDEPAMLARLLPGVPIITGRDRGECARVAVDLFGADLIVLDDGFQHRRLRREMDLVTLDAATPLERTRVLPAGPLREGPEALRRAHAAVVTRADDDGLFAHRAAEIAARCPGLPIYRSRHVPCRLRRPQEPSSDSGQPLSDLTDRPVAAFAGLAQPDAFRKTLEDLGVRLVRFDAFPDHHPFTADEVQSIVASGVQAGATLVLTSAKDGVRLPAAVATDPRLRILDIEARVDGLERLVESILTGCPRP